MLSKALLFELMGRVSTHHETFLEPGPKKEFTLQVSGITVMPLRMPHTF